MPGSGRSTASTELVEQEEGLLVVVDGAVVVADLVGDVAEAAECRRFALAVGDVSLDCEGGFAVCAGGLEVAEVGQAPPHHVDELALPGWLVECAPELQGGRGVFQGVFQSLPVAALLPDPGEHVVGRRLLLEIVVLFDYVE